MDLLSWTPASAVFWGGLAIMTWVSWIYRYRPETVLRLAAYPNGSIADQAEQWLHSRPGSH
jgi:hypothetical protein